MLNTVLFAKSEILEFFNTPWGFSAYMAASFVFLVLGFLFMKYIDNKYSYTDSYHPPQQQ
jgi:hypothetical protein